MVNKPQGNAEWRNCRKRDFSPIITSFKVCLVVEYNLQNIAPLMSAHGLFTNPGLDSKLMFQERTCHQSLRRVFPPSSADKLTAISLGLVPQWNLILPTFFSSSWEWKRDMTVLLHSLIKRAFSISSFRPPSKKKSSEEERTVFQLTS